jgi:hypothetical protein
MQYLYRIHPMTRSQRMSGREKMSDTFEVSDIRRCLLMNHYALRLLPLRRQIVYILLTLLLFVSADGIFQFMRSAIDLKIYTA